MEWEKVKSGLLTEFRSNYDVLCCKENTGERALGRLVFDLVSWKCVSEGKMLDNITHYCMVELPKEETKLSWYEAKACHEKGTCNCSCPNACISPF